MMENLIFDRTQNDLINKTKKSYYNYDDLNRVEKWCEYLSVILNEYNYKVDVVVKIDWNRKDFPSESEMERIRQNINRLKQAYFSFTQIPENLEYVIWQKANEIEKILFEIDKILEAMENNFVYCGVAGCGQNRLWQQRFRKLKIWNTQPYKLSQYANTDTVGMIATDNNESIKASTETLKLGLIDKRDDVFASIESINNSMQTIDDLVGYEAVYYTMKNLINDSSFENNVWNDTNGNSAYSTTEKCFGNRSLYFATGTTIVANIPVDRPIVGHKYYGRRYIKTAGDNQPADCRFEVFGGDGESMNWVYAWNNGNHPKWDFDSAIHEIVAVGYEEAKQTIIRCFNVNTTADTWVDGLMLIDLTEAFGSGKEPTKEWCDANIPYFSGTQTIKIRKESA